MNHRIFERILHPQVFSRGYACLSVINNINVEHFVMLYTWKLKVLLASHGQLLLNSLAGLLKTWLQFDNNVYAVAKERLCLAYNRPFGLSLKEA